MNLIDKLPRNYSELNYKDYIKILQTIPSEIPDGWDTEEYQSYIILVPLSILLDMPVIDLELMPATELIPMIERLAFMNEAFREPKNDIGIELRSATTLTYDQFVNYQSLRAGQWENMTEILKIMVKNKTDQEIENFSIQTCMDIFFLQNRSTLRSLRSSQISLAVQLLKIQIKMIMKKIWLKIKNLFSKVRS